MIKTGTHKCLWGNSLELDSMIRSNMALDYHIIDGEVPEMLITGRLLILAIYVNTLGLIGCSLVMDLMSHILTIILC